MSLGGPWGAWWQGRAEHMSFRLQQRGQCPGAEGVGQLWGGESHKGTPENHGVRSTAPLLPQGWPMTRRPCLRQEPQRTFPGKANLWLGMLQEGRGRLGGRDTPGIMTGICSWVADTRSQLGPQQGNHPKHEVIWGTHSGCRAHPPAGRHSLSGQAHSMPGSCPWAVRMTEAQLHLWQTGAPKPKLPKPPMGAQGPGSSPST